MLNNFYYFKGIVKFASLSRFDQYGKYSLSIVLDTGDIPKYNQSGIQRELKITDDGPVVTFARKPFTVGKDKKPIELGAPKVLDKNGQETDYFVMQGQPVVCKVRTYDTVKGVGCSLESVLLPDKEGMFADKAKFDDPDYDGLRF